MPLRRLEGDREELIAIGVYEFAHNGVLLAGFVAATRQIDQLGVGKFRSIRALQATHHEVSIGQELLADEACAIEVSVSRSLDPLNGKAGIIQQRALRGLLLRRIGIGLLSRRCDGQPDNQ